MTHSLEAHYENQDVFWWDYLVTLYERRNSPGAAAYAMEHMLARGDNHE